MSRITYSKRREFLILIGDSEMTCTLIKTTGRGRGVTLHFAVSKN